MISMSCVLFFCSSRRRHTRCALVTGVQTCALPISNPERSLQLSYEHARQAVALDGTDPAARVALSSAHLWRREHDAAIAEAKASIAVDPNYSLGHIIDRKSVV